MTPPQSQSHSDDVELHRELARIAATVEAGFIGLNTQFDEYKRTMAERHRENVARMEAIDESLTSVRERQASHQSWITAIQAELNHVRERVDAWFTKPSSDARPPAGSPVEKKFEKYGWFFLLGGTALIALYKFIDFVVHAPRP